ncbi:hypothetical protein G7Z17_g9523 [Cylindrodendrum hubeiense]|uniref:Uncharacterized protein n=1 Tax=Cylindrodendrum hubeiense TaxID=595255 RepID=A0A9P5H1C0_9HYPO|nr:hypothetical protein G7Z17_g9523 [Cylindrodendrum hubeiense]
MSTTSTASDNPPPRRVDATTGELGHVPRPTYTGSPQDPVNVRMQDRSHVVGAPLIVRDAHVLSGVAFATRSVTGRDGAGPMGSSSQNTGNADISYSGIGAQFSSS